MTIRTTRKISLFLLLFQKCIPTLRGERMYVSGLGNKVTAFVFSRHMANYRDVGLVLHLVVIRLGDGEQQFVVLSPTERTDCRVQIEFPGGIVGHWINGDFFFKEFASQAGPGCDV